MRKITQWIRDFTGLSPEIQEKIFASLLTLAIVWLLHKVIMMTLSRRKLGEQTRYRWRKNLSYAAYIVAIIVIGQIWVQQFSSLTTFLGLVSAGLAIALKDPILDLFGWAFILWRKPFAVGDRIQIGDHAGDVIDLRPFQFVMIEIGNWVDADQHTGRSILIPNSWIFNHPLANYNHELAFVFHEMPILLTFESDWKKAKGILDEIVKRRYGDVVKAAEKGLARAKEKYLIPEYNLPPSVVTQVKDSGVQLTLRFLCDARSRRKTEMQIWEEVLDAFAEEEGIDFAYPTVRFYKGEGG